MKTKKLHHTLRIWTCNVHVTCMYTVKHIILYCIRTCYTNERLAKDYNVHTCFIQAMPIFYSTSCRCMLTFTQCLLPPAIPLLFGHAEVCLLAPPNQHRITHTPAADERTASATLTCWSDPDSQALEDVSQGELAAIRGMQYIMVQNLYGCEICTHSLTLNGL